MKAIAIKKFGGPDVLEELDLPAPQPGPNEVLLRIKAAGVNPVDVKIRDGLFKDRMPYEFPIVLGWDAAGVVEAVGAQHNQYKKGDELFAYCRKERIHDGSYGEYIVLESRHLARKPKTFSFEEAAAIPLAGLTAYQCLFEGRPLQAGETILIHAGAGGVGGYAIQLAMNAGARVLTTASARNAEYVRQLGAELAIDYTREDFVKSVRASFPQGIDAVLDTVGGEVQKKSAEVLKKGGRFTSILALDEKYFVERGLVPRYVFVRPDSEQLNKLKDFAEHGILKVNLAATLPLAQAAKALEMIETHHTRGKIVLSIS
jgi:NADPH:quinone reductase and related Zn-dependent oxidoreductases